MVEAREYCVLSVCDDYKHSRDVNESFIDANALHDAIHDD